MDGIKKLPDAEFELMKIIWANEPPVSTNDIINQLDNEIEWKPQTVLTLLMRLIERGFLTSERKGKERIYFPAIAEQDYLQFETGHFMKKFYKNSFANLVSAMYDGKKLSEQDIKELSNLLKGER